MPVRRHFLGWDAPLTTRVCGVLLADGGGGLTDLSDTLVVVPTRQAGRRLREAMAAACAVSGGAVLSARVVTPAFLFAPPPAAGPEASESLQRAVWAAVLAQPAAGADEALLGRPDGRGDFVWALQTAGLLQQVLQTLSDVGLSAADVPARLGDRLPEPERWQSLAGLHAAFTARLSALGYADPLRRKMETAAAPELPAGILRIVVAGVPDPSLLTLRALEALAVRLDVDILIHAPEALADRFDEWGRPLESYWCAADIDIPDEQATLRVAATPADQVAAVLDCWARCGAGRSTFDLAVGAPDRALAPLLEQALAGIGITAFDPSEPAVVAHPLGRLLSAYADLVLTGDYRAVRTFLRQADALDCLQAGTGAEAGAVLRALDEFQNRHLPWRLADLSARVRADSAGGALRAAVAWAEALVGAFRAAGSMAAAVRGFLQQVYERRTIRVGTPADMEFRAAAEAVDEALHECDAGLQTACGLDAEHALRLFLRRLNEVTWARDRRDATLDVEGWLELPWNPAAVLIVTSMNEGVVPDSRAADAFLPDSIRRPLGLRDERQRLARDAFLLRSLIECRRRAGRVCLITGQTGAAGDPLMPSRLLCMCPDAVLAERARRVFARVEPDCAVSPSSIGFRLDPSPRTLPAQQALANRVLSVTAFRDYLACPFRYYLARVLGMEQLRDDRQGLDAAAFGTLIHNVLDEMAVEGAWHERDPARLAAFLHDRLDRQLERDYGRALSLPAQVARDSARQRLSRLAEIQVDLTAAGWDLYAPETKLTVTLGGFTVRGKLDRIDRHRDSGRLRIVDYKTSDKPADPQSLHLPALGRRAPDFAAVEVDGKSRRWADLQLPLYRLLYAAGAGRDPEPELAYFNLPRAIADAGVAVWDPFSAAVYAAAVACAETVCGRIAARQFWPPAPRVARDDFEWLLLDDPLATVDGAAFLAGLKGGAA